MTRQSSNARPWYFWPLIALAAGLVLGLIIGWGIWPVSYKNTLPQDLRPAERNAYLGMVAESYAASGDLPTAEERLVGWPRPELAKALADLQENLVNTDAKSAGDVQLLGQALNLGAVAPRPAAVPSQPAPQSAGTLLKTIATAVLWIILIVVGAAALVLLFTRWRNARSRQRSAPIGGAVSGGALGRAVRSAARLPEEVAPEAGIQPLAGSRTGLDETNLTSAGGRQSEDEGGLEFYEVERDRGDVPPAGKPAPEELRRPAASPVPAVAAEAPARVSAPPGGAGASLVKLSDDIAVYQMGEPDYDEAFDLNDPVAGYVGECGLQSNDLVGRNRDQAVALRVWLYDQRDSSTQLKVLMSEGAYRDTALRSQQAGGYEVLQVRPGAEFDLESHQLLLHGRIEKVDYTDQEPYHGVFAELQVRMQVHRKA